MKSIGAVGSLRELSLQDCKGITPEGMKYVGQLQKIQVLHSCS